MTGTEQETKRGRVRSALMTLGFRHPKGVSPEDGKRRLDRICDDLAYLSDESLRRVVGALRTKGEGASRCFWPERATFLAYAEIAQPRALEDAPGVASWFASAAGDAALSDGRLVAEFHFWERAKRPPLSNGERMVVEREADEMRSRLRRAEVAPVLDDAQWLAWYRAMEARALALVEAARRGDAQRQSGRGCGTDGQG